MKILLSWLLDHLNVQPSAVDVARIVALFNIRTAEIESFEQVSFSFRQLFIGVAKVVKSDKIELFCPELNQNVILPYRSDAHLDKQYLIYQEGAAWRWVVLADFCSDKDGIMPAVFIPDAQIKGAWRHKFATTDYVLDVDNKSINHRPDLWGHFGIAREVAAFLDVPLQPLESKLAHNTVQRYDAATSANKKNDGLQITIENLAACPQFSAVKCGDISYADSDPFIAVRLALVGIKPINAAVDLGNYVMLDIGHPMHVFDAQAFKDGEMVVRNAKQGEPMTLLDGQEIKLSSQDIVVATASNVESLAGIMGGKNSSYQPTTKSIILEAAGFDAATIRKTAQRFKIRTEASMRFEKELDPAQSITALQRFLFLGNALGILHNAAQLPIVSVGKIPATKQCVLTHAFLESKLGTKLTTDFVSKVLGKLGFELHVDEKAGQYTVTVPSYRGSKDVKIKEDLVEEVIRSYGFENITPVLPVRQMAPFDTSVVQNIRKIKRILAYGLNMHELRDYMLYDASWVSKLSMDLTAAVRVKSPLSENWTTLVTSLVPHLLKAVDQNRAQKDHIRFFEMNRSWQKTISGYQEHKVIAGIIFDKKSVDFYESKAELQKLWDTLGLTVTYAKPNGTVPAWYESSQVAQLSVGGTPIGFAGMLSAVWARDVIDGKAFIFELNGDFLETVAVQQAPFKHWSKYQEVSYDISLFVPLAMTADRLLATIKSAHQLISGVEVVDFFEKAEWGSDRAVTVRYHMVDHEKTMTKSDLDAIVASVQNALKDLHVRIR